MPAPDWEEIDDLNHLSVDGAHEFDEVRAWLDEASLGYRVFACDGKWTIVVSNARNLAISVESDLDLTQTPLAITTPDHVDGVASPEFPSVFAYLAIAGAQKPGAPVAGDLALDLLGVISMQGSGAERVDLAICKVDWRQTEAGRLPAEAHPRQIKEPFGNLKGREDWFQKRHGSPIKPRSKPGSKQ